jgi:triacylglycerol lipase
MSNDDVKSGSKFSLSFSSLPSSFTTLLLSIVDSPAYSNLTTAFLNNVFNPATPDDPNVKYFSVAGRLSSMSIWHPLWLPKAILDETEKGERLKLKKTWEERQELDRMGADDVDGVPLWGQEKEWGNDGLVTVQSAKWGEYLGVMEGCDRKIGPIVVFSRPYSDDLL